MAWLRFLVAVGFTILAGFVGAVMGLWLAEAWRSRRDK